MRELRLKRWCRAYILLFEQPSNELYRIGVCIWWLEFELNSLLELRLLLLIPRLLSNLDHVLDHIRD